MNLAKQISTCCPSLLSGFIGASEAVKMATVFKVLGEPARLQILSLIAAQPTGEACVCELTEPLGLSQPTVSHHLKVLHEVGLLERERRGTWIYYKIVPERIGALQNAFALPS